MPRSSHRWYVWLLSAVAVSALTFTPIVIKPGSFEPGLLGVPRTLWMGILITVALVFLTFLAARSAPNEAEGEETK